MADRPQNDTNLDDESPDTSADQFPFPLEDSSRRNFMASAGTLGTLLVGGAAVAGFANRGDDDAVEQREPNIQGSASLDEGDTVDANDDEQPDTVEQSDTDEQTDITDPALEAHIDRHDLPEPPTLEDIDTQRTRDAIDDLGLDPTGDQPIQDTLVSELSDGDRIEFPDGTFRLSNHLAIDGYSDFSLVGSGDTTFVVDSGLTQTVLSYRNCRDCAFVGIDFDQSADDCSAQTAFNVSGRLVVADVEFVGWSDPDNSGKKIAFNVRDSSGVATFDRVIANDGTEVGRQGVDHNDVHKQQYDGAYWAGPPHEGTAYFIDCEAAHWSDNGIYASRTNGGVVVVGGLYANSSISQVRLGHPESFVGGGCHMVVDRDQIPTENNPDGLAFTRGIWLESGHLDNPGATVGRCFIDVGSVGSFGGCINVAPTGANAVIEGPVEVIAPGSIDRVNASPSIDLVDGAIQNVDVFSADPGGRDDEDGSADNVDSDDIDVTGMCS